LGGLILCVTEWSAVGWPAVVRDHPFGDGYTGAKRGSTLRRPPAGVPANVVDPSLDLTLDGWIAVDEPG
jgi:hypothetical protein